MVSANGASRRGFKAVGLVRHDERRDVFFRHAEKKTRKKAPPDRLMPPRSAFASRRQKRAGRPSCARKNKKRFRRSSARDRLGARRAASDRAIVRARPPRRRRSRDTRRGAGRARGGPPRPVARDVGSGGLDAPSCVLCHAGASYLFAVTPPWRASALPAATPRVASANAAIPRLRTDLDAIATGGRARTATEARRAMRAALSKRCSKNISPFREFRFV